jgi:3-hydroxyisobutyrate dehydrogenase
MSLTVAFIGLGAMGYRMAAHLPKAFEQVWVWNRNFAKAQQHAQCYGSQALSLEQATQADIIFSCLPTSMEVENIITQHPPKAGAIWVDCTSGEPESAQRMQHFLQAHQADFLDAPVSGQTIGAENGTLTVMVGGEASAFARAQVAIQPFAGLIQHVGAAGAGFAVKAVNNMLLAVHLWAAAEGFSLLKAHGVALASALNCINQSSGKSGVSENILAQRIFNRDFPLTFALPLLAKDTGIALNLAQQAKLPTPLLSLTQNLIQTAHLSSDPASDFSAAVKLYESWSKITLE